MARAPFTEYEVQQLVDTRKFVFRVMQDNVEGGDPRTERRVIYEIRRKDMPNKDIRLRLGARVAPSLPGIGVKPTPGVALQWRNKIVRKLDYALRHESVRDGIVIGYVRGWHHHLWTDEDEDRYIVEPDPPVKGGDMRSVIRWCADKWNIELGEIDDQLNFGGR